MKKEGIVNITGQQLFLKNTGAHEPILNFAGLPRNPTEIDIFDAFFPLDYGAILCEDHNRRKRLHPKAHKKPQEFMAFMHTFVAMALNGAPSMKEWTRDGATSFLSPNCFETIHRDFLLKGQTLAKFLKKFQELALLRVQPGGFLAMDEQMWGTQMESIFKVYIERKPTNWGFKCFVIACKLPGDLNPFIISIKPDLFRPAITPLQSLEWVIEVLEPYRSRVKGVILDSWFSSVTFQQNHSEFPFIIAVHSNQISKFKQILEYQLELGQYRNYVWGSSILSVWKDRGFVVVLTNAHAVISSTASFTIDAYPRSESLQMSEAGLTALKNAGISKADLTIIAKRIGISIGNDMGSIW